VQLGRQALEPPGEARQDLAIIVAMAQKLGLDWTYDHPRDVFDEMRQADAVDRRHYVGPPRARKRRSPTLAKRKAIRERASYSRRTSPPNPAAQVRSRQGHPAAEQPDSEYPFVLITGRQLEHWHTGSMTRRTEVLDAIEPDPVVSVHSLDLAAMNVPPDGMITVASRRGSISLRAARRRRHAPRRRVHSILLLRGGREPPHEPRCSTPFGKIPEFKYCAVRVTPAAPRAKRAATDRHRIA
jgi:formate dehydrogenase major subunit